MLAKAEGFALTFKLIVDEDVPSSVLNFLRNAGLAYETLEEYGLIGATNSEIIHLSMKENLIIVTLHEDFVKMYLYSKLGGEFGVLV
ncbi:MAG: hypothetical protein AOA65_0425 [Candidatus Bathyarchaeota archaeon BA1]|nr:MAG: hypothetical protein AOA65_0425 [Candidatus Bathyarchaeota archaeon BA1]